MADAYFLPHTISQQGWEHPGIAIPINYEWNYFGTVSFDPGRFFLTRFGDVNLPVGATISAARLVYTLNAKNPGDAQTVTYHHVFESTGTNNSILKQDSAPLRENYVETSAGDRAWTQHITSATYNWPSSPAGTYNEMSVDVTSALQNGWTTNSGRHMSLTFMLYISAESGDLALNNHATDRPVALHVTYSGGTAENSVVLVNENPNFVAPTVTQDDGFVKPNLYSFNSFFGQWGVPQYQQLANDGAIVAPQGGNIIKVTATEDKHTALFLENLETGAYAGNRRLVPGEWLTFSGYVYVPSNVDRVRCLTSPASINWLSTTVRGQWQRIFGTFQHSIDYGIFMGFVSDRSPMQIGQFFYVANVNVTRGRELYPYFDGNTTDTATYHRTFDWGGGTTGKRNGGTSYVILDNAPTATLENPLPSASTHKNMQGRWSYSDPYSEAQSGFRLEARKKKVQG